MKRCAACGISKALAEFYARKERPNGYSSSCKQCIRARTKAWQESNRDRYLELNERWRQRHPEKVQEMGRMRARRGAVKRHDGPGERARLMADQDGRCYLCRLPFKPGEKIDVDHDHSCCEGSRNRTDSCRACRRGLAHPWCNQIIGLAREDMDLLRAIADNFEPVRDATKARIASQNALMPALF